MKAEQTDDQMFNLIQCTLLPHCICCVAWNFRLLIHFLVHPALTLHKKQHH